MGLGSSAVTILLFVVALIVVVKAIRVVPQQHAWIVERLGRFHAVLEPGLNFVIPFIDRVAFRHDLREIPLDVPSQICITKDNTQLQVDGILYFQVTDPRLASYGSTNYLLAITQLAQTTLRSVIGRMELDKTFEEREQINTAVVSALDDAAPNWGVKVLRYEIKDLTPPAEILRAMQAQITAEREKRAVIATSEGRRQEQINIAQGAREAAIAKSEGEKQAEINNAQGQAAAILAIAEANAKAIEPGYDLMTSDQQARVRLEVEAGLALLATHGQGRWKSKILVRDTIADVTLQQVLTRPKEFDVIATPNLNGDYLSDALAAQVGGIGIAPGGNINYLTGHAVFEATHGTAPKYANQDVVNPGSVILSGEMMLRYMGWTEAADAIITGMDRTIGQKTVTYDFARLMEGAKQVKTSEFADALIKNM